jgi:hypothetical protein
LYPGREYCALINLTIGREINNNIIKAAIPYSRRIFSDNGFVNEDGGFIASAGVRVA